jgi:hypothetical protein
MINKPRRKRPKFYVPSDYSHLAQPGRIRHSAFTNTAGKVSVRNSFVTVPVATSQDPSSSEEVPHISLSFDNYDVNINDQSIFIPLDTASVSVGRRRTQVCKYNSDNAAIVSLGSPRMNRCWHGSTTVTNILRNLL